MLRPAPELRALAVGVVRLVARRQEGLLVLGEPPPGGMAEAVGAGEIALVPSDDASGVRLVLAIGDGRTLTTSIALASPRGREAARAVVLAAEDLIASAAAAPPPELERDRADAEVWAYQWSLYHPEAVLGPRGPPRSLAKPAITLRLLLGYTLTRGHALIGPGIGFGLCVERWCVLYEGDLPLVPEERLASDGRLVQYLPVSFSMRVHWRPTEWGDFAPGLTVGLLTRVGVATLVGADEDRVASNLGVRATAELAWRFSPPFELVAEAGLDYAVNRAEFVRFEESIVLEDRSTPWFVFSGRLRP